MSELLDDLRGHFSQSNKAQQKSPAPARSGPQLFSLQTRARSKNKNDVLSRNAQNGATNKKHRSWKNQDHGWEKPIHAFRLLATAGRLEYFWRNTNTHAADERAEDKSLEVRSNLRKQVFLVRRHFKAEPQWCRSRISATVSS